MKKISLTVLFSSIIMVLQAQNITTIDLTQVKFGEIPANRIFEEIKYIRLETHKDALLNYNWVSFYLTDKYIIACNSFRAAYLFDRETGSFRRKVSSIGRGPDEYTGMIYHIYGFNEKNNIIYADDGGPMSKYWKCINITTNKIESILNKPLDNSIERYAIWAPWLIRDNMYISFCNNITGNDRIKLIVFDKDGNLIKKYPNYLEYEKGKNNSTPYTSGIFYYYKGLTYFKEHSYNDTVFQVDEKRILPHAIFKLGDKQPSYYYQKNVAYNKGKYKIEFVYESDSFILFNFRYYSETSGGYPGWEDASDASVHTGYYDKKNKQSYISSTPDYKKSGYTAPGLPISFYPIAININNEIIGKINPEELVNNKHKIDSKYRQQFQTIQEDDNPIVVIAKLKK